MTFRLHSRLVVWNLVIIGLISAILGYFLNFARHLDPYVLRLAMPLSSVDSFIRDLRSQLAFAMLLALGLTVVFGYVVFGLISRPLRDIAAASKKLAAGNLDQRLPITGDE